MARHTAAWKDRKLIMTTKQAFACLEMCKPQLGLTLISMAARFCQTLGYNRLPLVDAANSSERQRNIFLFWQVYIYDSKHRFESGTPAYNSGV